MSKKHGGNKRRRRNISQKQTATCVEKMLERMRVHAAKAHLGRKQKKV